MDAFSRHTSTESTKQQIDSITQSIDAKTVEFSHFFRNAFIAFLADAYARLNMPTYMLSTGDQRYWSGEFISKSPAGNKPSNSLEYAFEDAKNFVNVVPRCIVEIKSPRVVKQALGMQDTQIRVIATINSVPVAMYSTMRRIPIDFAITLQIYATDWLTSLDVYEQLLNKLYQLNSFAFVWAGTMHAASYEFDISDVDAKHAIMHSSDNDSTAIITVPAVLHLQYPALNSQSNVWAGDDTIYDGEHNIDIENPELDINITFGGCTDESRIVLRHSGGGSTSGGASANLSSGISNDGPFCQNGSCYLNK